MTATKMKVWETTELLCCEEVSMKKKPTLQIIIHPLTNYPVYCMNVF